MNENRSSLSRTNCIGRRNHRSKSKANTDRFDKEGQPSSFDLPLSDDFCLGKRQCRLGLLHQLNRKVLVCERLIIDYGASLKWLKFTLANAAPRWEHVARLMHQTDTERQHTGHGCERTCG